MNSGIKIEKKKANLNVCPNSDSTQMSSGEDRGHYNVSKPHSSDTEEYRPLPSPSCSPPRSKELRVTFLQDNSKNFLKKRPVYQPLRDTVPTALSKTNQQPLLSPTLKKPEGEPSYLDSDPRTYGSDRALDSTDCTDAYWPTSEPGPASVPQSLPQKPTELESHTDKLLQLSSDLYVSTHLPDVAIPVQSFSEKGSKQRSPHFAFSMESLPQPNKPKPQQSTPLTTHPSLLRPKDGAPKGLKTTKQSTLAKEKTGSYLLPAFQHDGPDLCLVLRTLLDLVDQHWSGPFSLHLNPSFMAQAIRLLMPLASPDPPFQSESVRNVRKINDEQPGKKESSEWWNSLQHEEQNGVKERRTWEKYNVDIDVTEADFLKRQLNKTQNELESLKKRLISSVKENYILRSDKRKVTACLKHEVMPLVLDEHLQKEAKVLQEQEKLMKQLEQTVILLQSNQRSLVSHNNLLLNMTKTKPSELNKTL